MGVKQSYFANAVTIAGNTAVTGTVTATGKISTSSTSYYYDSLWYPAAPTLDQQRPGLALSTTDVFGNTWNPGLTADCTKDILFYVSVYFVDGVTTADAVAFALKYTAATYEPVPTDAGGTDISATPSTTTGVTNAATFTLDSAGAFDKRASVIGPFTIAAATFAANPDLLLWTFTTTLTGFSANEVELLGVELQYARSYV